MFLITPSLLNAFTYYFNFDAEPVEGDDGNVITSAEREAKARAEFLQTLRRERSTPTEAMQKGIDFENRVKAFCDGMPDDSPVIQEIGAIIGGGHWQATMKRQLDDFLLYARADIIKGDTIYDIKRTSSYDLGKYQNSAQHRIELYCAPMIPRFSYLISNEREWWREDYHNHAGIEQELRDMLRQFMGYLRNDHEARDIYFSKWPALEAQAA